MIYIMSKIKLSIISITWNNIDGLKRTYESLQRQCFEDFEWIIVDGGSVDGSKELVDDLQIDNLIYIHEPDEGIYDAMNKGMSKSQGDYLNFMNAGDEFAYDNTLSLLNDHLVENYSLIYGDSFEEFLNGHYEYKKALSKSMIWYTMFAHHQSMFYRADLAKSIMYDLSYKYIADRVMTFRVLNQDDNVKYLNEALCRFEAGGVSQSKNKNVRDLIYKERRRFLVEECSLHGVFADISLLAKKQLDWIKMNLPVVYKVLRYKK